MSATDQPKSVVSGFTGPEMDAAAQARWPKDGQMLERNAFREGAYWAAEALAAAPLPQAGELWAVGSWLSAALDDPKVCAEMKADINAWFEGGGHVRQSLAQPAPAPQGEDGWSELERLARAALDATALYENPPVGQVMAAVEWRALACDAFEVAANPSTILKLIAAARSLPDSLSLLWRR